MGKKKEQVRPYQPVNSYGVIGNCYTAVLIAPDGSIDWGCFPDFDSPAVFCRLLDAQQGGFFQISPADPTISGSQRYLRESNILRTTFTAATGTIQLTDFMPVATLSAGSYRALDNNTWTHDEGSCHCLVRSIVCTEGELVLNMRLKVTPNYALEPVEILLLPNHAGAVVSGGSQHVGLAVIGMDCLPPCSLTVSAPDGDQHSLLCSQLTLREGERMCFVLGVGRSAQAARWLVEEELPRHNFDWELAHTLSCWRKWVADCTYHGPYQEWVHRSALTLKMLSYAPTGAIVAAATTSLPEQEGGERNWDYRFTWLRDAAFTLYSLNRLGFTEETYAFTCWLLRLSSLDTEELQIMYSIRGEQDLPESELTHLAGYRASWPVRIGNAAAQQKQLDVFGEVLDCIYLYWCQGCAESYRAKPDGRLWALLRVLVEYVCHHWQEADSGIWEVRGQKAHFVYSKVMCWVALDRGIQAAQQFHLEADLPRWRAVREQIHSEVLNRGYNPLIHAFTQRYEETALDASSLLLPFVGFIAPDDPRMVTTVERIREQLTDEQGFVYRYRNEDGLHGQEGTFIVCTLWLIDNLAMEGRLEEARELLERILACAGPLGLFSEEIKPGSQTAWGNYPQALSHIALINSIMSLRDAELRQAHSKSA